MVQTQTREEVMKVPEWIRIERGKQEDVDGIRLKCLRCQAEAGIYTDVERLREEFVRDFVEHHRNCKRCEGGVCEL